MRVGWLRILTLKCQPLRVQSEDNESAHVTVFLSALNEKCIPSISHCGIRVASPCPGNAYCLFSPSWNVEGPSWASVSSQCPRQKGIPALQNHGVIWDQKTAWNLKTVTCHENIVIISCIAQERAPSVKRSWEAVCPVAENRPGAGPSFAHGVYQLCDFRQITNPSDPHLHCYYCSFCKVIITPVSRGYRGD